MMVPKKTQKCENTGSRCLDKPVLGQGAGGARGHRSLQTAPFTHEPSDMAMKGPLLAHCLGESAEPLTTRLLGG